jgi:hypothetical protein
MVYAKHIIGSEIILDTSYVLLGDDAQVEARYGPIGDGVKLDAR